jgi:hypothetical protein
MVTGAGAILYYVNSEGTVTTTAGGYGPYRSRGQAIDVSKAIRSGKLAPTPEENKRRVANAIIQPTSGTRRPVSRNRRKLGGGVSCAGCALMLIVGLIINSATANKNALCSSVIGQIGQQISSSANLDCSTVSGLRDLASIFIWFGGAGLVLAVLLLILEGAGRATGKA